MSRSDVKSLKFLSNEYIVNGTTFILTTGFETKDTPVYIFEIIWKYISFADLKVLDFEIDVRHLIGAKRLAKR